MAGFAFPIRRMKDALALRFWCNNSMNVTGKRDRSARSTVSRAARRDIALLYARIRPGLTYQRGAVAVLVFAELEQRYQRADASGQHAQAGREAAACPDLAHVRTHRRFFERAGDKERAAQRGQ